MGRFLRDNWMWIAVPLLLALALIALAVLLFGAESDAAQFIYTL